jgi:hypothetical protein
MELAEAVKAGLSGPEMCAKFGVTKQALSKRVRALNLSVGKSALLERAGMMLDHAMDVRRRFVEISDKIRRSADFLEERLQDSEGVLDTKVMALYLAAKEEERRQLEFLGKVLDNYLKTQQLMAVQQAIIQEIGAESAECAARIRRRLGSLHSSGLLFQFDGRA